MAENTDQIGQGIITQVSGQNYKTIILHSYSLSLIAKCEFRIANLPDEFAIRNSHFAILYGQPRTRRHEKLNCGKVWASFFARLRSSVSRILYSSISPDVMPSS